MANDSPPDAVESAEDGEKATKRKDPKSKRRGSELTMAAIGAALRAVLGNIQALELNLALKALSVFRESSEDGVELAFEDVLDGLRELDLSLYVEGAGEDQVGTAAAHLGDGEEARRQLRLWSASSVGGDFGSCNEQCFMWLAWRGRRFVDAGELLWPLFSALDADCDGHVRAEDIDRAFQAAGMPLPKKKSRRADPLSALAQLEKDPNESFQDMTAKADLQKIRSEISELLAYHADGNSEDSYLAFADFVALVCDAQDKFALHRLSINRPASLMTRYDRGVLFMRPEELSCFAKSADREEIEKMSSKAKSKAEDRQELMAAKTAAEQALAEAHAAKEAAEATARTVKEHLQYLDSPAMRSFFSEESQSRGQTPQKASSQQGSAWSPTNPGACPSSPMRDAFAQSPFAFDSPVRIVHTPDPLELSKIEAKARALALLEAEQHLKNARKDAERAAEKARLLAEDAEERARCQAQEEAEIARLKDEAVERDRLKAEEAKLGEQRKQAAKKIQAGVRGKQARHVTGEMKRVKQEEMERQDAAATKLQSVMRGKRHRAFVNTQKAELQQQNQRAVEERRQKMEVQQREATAATKIQALQRGKADRRQVQKMQKRLPHELITPEEDEPWKGGLSMSPPKRFRVGGESPSNRSSIRLRREKGTLQEPKRAPREPSVSAEEEEAVVDEDRMVPDSLPATPRKVSKSASEDLPSKAVPAESKVESASSSLLSVPSKTDITISITPAAESNHKAPIVEVLLPKARVAERKEAVATASVLRRHLFASAGQQLVTVPAAAKQQRKEAIATAAVLRRHVFASAGKEVQPAERKSKVKSRLDRDSIKSEAEARLREEEAKAAAPRKEAARKEAEKKEAARKEAQEKEVARKEAEKKEAARKEAEQQRGAAKIQARVRGIYARQLSSSMKFEEEQAKEEMILKQTTFAVEKLRARFRGKLKPGERFQEVVNAARQVGAQRELDSDSDKEEKKAPVKASARLSIGSDAWLAAVAAEQAVEKASPPEPSPKAKQLEAMGFPADQVAKALKMHDDDFDLSLQSLLAGPPDQTADIASKSSAIPASAKLKTAPTSGTPAKGADSKEDALDEDDYEEWEIGEEEEPETDEIVEVSPRPPIQKSRSGSGLPGKAHERSRSPPKRNRLKSRSPSRQGGRRKSEISLPLHASPSKQSPVILDAD